MYNLTVITASNNLYDLMMAVNTMSDGLFGLIFLVCSGIVLMAAMKNYPFRSSFPVACFVTSILAVLFRLLGLISDKIVICAIVLTGISVVMLFTKDEIAVD